jgi:cell filamentation protein
MSGVLRNKLGLKDADALHEAEYAHTAGRIQQLVKHPIPGNFDIAHLCAIHKHIFQDVYDWAGKPRTVNISKENSLFCLCEYMPSWMNDIHGRLIKDDYLRGLDKPAFVDKITHFHGDVDGLHPFREGNGRATRVFIDQLTRQAGYVLDQEKIEQNKKSWSQAAAPALYGQEDRKKAFFIDAIRPGRAVAFALQPQTEALKPRPELADAFNVLRQAERYFSTKLPAASQKAALAQARAHIQNQLEAGKTGDFRESWKKPEKSKPSRTPKPEKTEPDIERSSPQLRRPENKKNQIGIRCIGDRQLGVLTLNRINRANSPRDSPTCRQKGRGQKSGAPGNGAAEGNTPMPAQRPHRRVIAIQGVFSGDGAGRRRLNMRSRNGGGQSMASSKFLIDNPSSVSPSMLNWRLKNRVSGSSWRVSRRK